MAVEGAPWMLCLCYPLAASPSSEAIYSHHSHALSAWIGYGRRIQNFKNTEVACCSWKGLDSKGLNVFSKDIVVLASLFYLCRVGECFIPSKSPPEVLIL